MNDRTWDRRQFVGWMGGLGAGLSAVRMLHAEIAAEGRQVRWETFTASQAPVIEAVTSCIIPTDDSPGAREAGVARFIDRWLARYEPESKPVYSAGLLDLARRVRTKHPRASSFAALTEAEQVALLGEIQKGDFFLLARNHSIMGYLGHPSYGGNRGEVGWKAVGFENHGISSAPFGWYDTPGNDAR